MGELMRWRLTRAPQRRVPSQQKLLDLGGSFQLSSSTNNRLESHFKKAHGAGGGGGSVAADFLNALTDANSLRNYLSTGSGSTTSAAANAALQAAAALLKVDEWLAANAPSSIDLPPYSTPPVDALNKEVTTELGSFLPNSSGWSGLHQLLSELYYVALYESAVGPLGSHIDVLGMLTRLLLVTALIDDLEANPSPITSSDDIYDALRWRTIVIPDNVAALIRNIRAQKKAVAVRKPGFADLYVTREEWDHYEAAEVASIENILGRELKNRVHLLVNQTTTTTTTDQTTSTVTEQDTTTTDLSQLQQQSSSDITIAAHVDGKVDVSAQYGTAQINAHVGGSFDYSDKSAVSKATTQSHETVSRAVNKIEQTTRQIRTVSTLTKAIDREKHEFDNRLSSTPVVGVYRWVDQVQNIELDRYPHRFLMEFEVPEPGAWTRWLINKNVGKDLIHPLPVPLTVDGNAVSDTNPMIQAKDLSADPNDPNFYGKYVARYLAPGISPAPSTQVVAATLGFPNSGTSVAGNQGNELVYVSNATLGVPTGYYAANWAASALMYNSGNNTAFGLEIAVGAGQPVTAQAIGRSSGSVGPISIGNIPITIQAKQIYGFEVNVEVTCNPLQQTLQKWQNDTFDAVVSAYYALLQAHNDEKAGKSIQQTSVVDVGSPAQNMAQIKQELKRQVIEMLIGTRFTGFLAVDFNPNGVGAPSNKLDVAAAIAPAIQFLEQAFEWETMSYICYPYYWTDSTRWADLAVIQGNDSNFADFLRSGSARVVLAARPGFEDQVNFFIEFGIIWGGGPIPAPGDPTYLSIADEIKEMQQRPLDVTVVDTWQVRLPTTLIWLENPNGLPKNGSPTIDTKPKIKLLSATSGVVGDLITISGDNFGDIMGNSSVAFNATLADSQRWSSGSILVTVPAAATTGDVVVTVNGVDSNGTKFKVS